jgi:hypothetical protein
MPYILPEIDEKIYDIQIKRGMKFALQAAHPSSKAKKGDVVKVTSVTAMGRPSPGFYNDYEALRVSNGIYSWRVSREDLCIIK